MTPNPRGFPAQSPTELACEHAHTHAKRPAQDVGALDVPLVNHRYLAALARHRAPRPIAPSATIATVKLWHDEKRVKFDVTEAGGKRTVRTKIQRAFARVRYGSKRRAWFILRTSSHGATVHDSRAGGCRRSFAFIHADLSRMQLDAATICAHLRSVLIERAAKERAPQFPPIENFVRPIERAPLRRAKVAPIPAPDFANMHGAGFASHNRAQVRKSARALAAIVGAPRRITNGSPRVK